MGGVVSAGVDNDDLVDKLKEADYIKSINVEKVFRLVDRGYYLTKENQNVAYRDNAWRSGNLHISAPCIYAQVMEGLKIGPGMSFLNIGSGTGYLSTMAGLLIGPNGVNHGVELHGDVVEYARERLSWFVSNTGGIDVSSFCEPQFTQGNALCFPEDTYLYDRVYCGASCPASHEAYMKNLIKVDGVLVMPKNDKLLKITRTSKTTWTTDSLLPVSFSSLVMPDQNFGVDCVELPLVRFVTLQELTREVIRSRFRSSIEIENKELKDAFVHTIPPQPAKERRHLCRVNRTFPHISLSYTEYDSDGSEGQDQERERETVVMTQRMQANQLTAFLELARSLAMNRSAAGEGNRPDGQRNDEAADEEEEEEDDDNDNEVENGNEEEVEEEEEEGKEEGERRSNRSSESENMVVDVDDEMDSNLDLFRMLGRDMASATATTTSRSCERDSSSTSKVDEKTEAQTVDNNPEMVTAITVTNDSGAEEDALASVDVKEEEVKNQKEGNEGESSSKNNSATPSSNPHTEDEEMVELSPSKITTPLVEGSCSSNGRKSSSKKSLKKREKFDSGIVEDIDPIENMEEDESCSYHSRSSSSNSSSTSDSSDAEADERCGGEACKGRHGDDTECGNSGSSNGGRRKWWRKSEINRRRRRTMRFYESTDSKQPIDKFSRCMREKIEALPLPHPLKIYINYNRPL